MRDKIAADYPGTLLAITGGTSAAGCISGAVAGGVLGIFGREGVASRLLGAERRRSCANAAFRAYRNYDGAGAAFGDTSSPPPATPHRYHYASLDATNPGRVVIIAINRRTAAKTGITVAHPATFRAPQGLP